MSSNAEYFAKNIQDGIANSNFVLLVKIQELRNKFHIYISHPSLEFQIFALNNVETMRLFYVSLTSGIRHENKIILSLSPPK